MDAITGTLSYSHTFQIWTPHQSLPHSTPGPRCSRHRGWTVWWCTHSAGKAQQESYFKRPLAEKAHPGSTGRHSELYLPGQNSSLVRVAVHDTSRLEAPPGQQAATLLTRGPCLQLAVHSTEEPHPSTGLRHQ
jgi:hypothetical protein